MCATNFFSNSAGRYLWIHFINHYNFSDIEVMFLEDNLYHMWPYIIIGDNLPTDDMHGAPRQESLCANCRCEA